MNFECTICGAVLTKASSTDRCAECGARAVFQTPTKATPRHARGAGNDSHIAWEFAPDGPVLRRIR